MVDNEIAVCYDGFTVRAAPKDRHKKPIGDDNMVNVNELNVGDVLTVVDTTVKASKNPLAEAFGLSVSDVINGDLVTNAQVGDNFEVMKKDELGAVIEIMHDGEKRRYIIGSSDSYDNRHCFEKVSE